MIYECQECQTVLSPGLWACPQCGDQFDEPVPDDAAFGRPPNVPFPVLPPPAQRPFVPELPFSRKTSRRVQAFRTAIILVVILSISVGLGAIYARQKRHNLIGAFLPQHIVTYRVTGTVRTVEVTYQNGIGGTEQVSAAPLPWSQTYTVNSGTYLYLSAQTGSKSGRVRTEIDVDGKRRKTAVTEGAYVTVYVNDNLR